MTPTQPKSHVFSISTADQKQCWCGIYHYVCRDCGVDCTMGTSAGPATTDIAKTTRCDECNRLWDRRRAALSPSNEAEITVIKKALTLIANTTSQSEEHTLATLMLGRLHRSERPRED